MATSTAHQAHIEDNYDRALLQCMMPSGHRHRTSLLEEDARSFDPSLRPMSFDAAESEDKDESSDDGDGDGDDTQ